MDTDRRGFLKTAILGGVLGREAATADASVALDHPADTMGVLVDLTKCNGCRRCEAACRRANGFDVPTEDQLKDPAVFAERRHPGPHDYTVVNAFPAGGAVPNNGSVYVKRNCLHCNEPACVSACLVGALRKQPNGAVTYDAYKCMGCRYCMVACPFQIPAYEYDNAFTPQVRKCTLCTSRKDQADDEVPACVRACPKECLRYAKRDELIQAAHAKIAEQPDVYLDHVYGEHEAGGTAWLYLSSVSFGKLGFPSLGPDAPRRLSESIQHGVFAYFMPPVAWCGILALAMWLTRPRESVPEETAEESYPAARPGSNGREARGRTLIHERDLEACSAES